MASKKELLSSAMKRTSEWFTSYLLLHVYGYVSIVDVVQNSRFD